ncbi:MAG: ABC transporter ATP-binding protein [Bacteroidales bacterium]|nr:ABC transporter ATP-binding protein [Bacteroidales bacterium]
MIELKSINKSFQKGKKQIKVLSDFDINIKENSFSIIKGQSGCGKSTLLFTMGGLLKPDSGEVKLLGQDLYQLNQSSRRVFTAKTIGFVFQSYHLLSYLSVRDNILVQQRLSYIQLDLDLIDDMINELHLQDRLNHKPGELSAGEKQRVALVRSLAANPKLILADEPTGNLDPENSEIVLSFLKRFQQKGGTIAMVSHSSDADQMADQIIHLKK